MEVLDLWGKYPADGRTARDLDCRRTSAPAQFIRFFLSGTFDFFSFPGDFDAPQRCSGRRKDLAGPLHAYFSTLQDSWHIFTLLHGAIFAVLGTPPLGGQGKGLGCYSRESILSSATAGIGKERAQGSDGLP